MFLFLLDKYLEAELLVGIYLTLKEMVKQFSKVITSLYTPNKNVWEFQLLHIPVSIWCTNSFKHNHTGGCVMIPSYSINVNVPNK